MKKIEYLTKKRMIAQFDDDADELSLVSQGLAMELCKMDEAEEEKAGFEIRKIISEFRQLENEENAEEKMKNLIEKYRKEIEKASLIEDEIADKEAETKL